MCDLGEIESAAEALNRRGETRKKHWNRQCCRPAAAAAVRKAPRFPLPEPQLRSTLPETPDRFEAARPGRIAALGDIVEDDPLDLRDAADFERPFVEHLRRRFAAAEIP